MGTDIHGWLEQGYDRDGTGSPDHWSAILNVTMVFNRSYDFFGSFFGVNNYANFEPVAADRGLPSHRSRTVENTFPDGDTDGTIYHSPTWMTLDHDISWRDIPRVEHPEEFDRSGWRRATRTYKYSTDGELLEKEVSLVYEDGTPLLSDEEFQTLKRRRSVESGEYRYESYPITRSEAGASEWYRLRRVCRRFEQLRFADDEHLRLVVWFDN